MEEKRQIRDRYRAMRDALTAFERESMSEQIADRLFEMDAIRGDGVILCYASTGSEVVTCGVIGRLLAQGRSLALPVTLRQTQTMYAARLDSPASLRRGGYGILEPGAGAERVRPADIGAVLLPGLAFGRDGYRVGYGKGYYDRFLVDCPSAVKIALAYGFQILGSVPHEPHDLPAHYIVTPEEVICCG